MEPLALNDQTYPLQPKDITKMLLQNLWEVIFGPPWPKENFEVENSINLWKLGAGV